MLALGLGGACKNEALTQSRQAPPSTQPTAIAAPVSVATKDAAVPNAGPQGPEVRPPSCPPGMILIEGARFWAGRRSPGGNPEEHPAFESRVHSFCLDATEVTTDAYARCVDAGTCTTAKRERITCTEGRADKGAHPINCVTWDQAVEYCQQAGARLPTELEWEYAARGGTEYRKYSWGDEPPDGHACWKRNQTCPIKSYPAGAFGLYDMNGNVWEWTASGFARYPWPDLQVPHRVYRGGSWSRRFEKWMSLTLRNRYTPGSYGSHLGFRCAALPAGGSCPYGQELRDGARYCRHGVEAMECPKGLAFNGQRCAAPTAPLCPRATEPQPGRGCVPSAPAAGAAMAPAEGGLPLDEVVTTRDPRFDGDCGQYSKRRTVAYRFSGGSHAARNHVGNGRGCKNRDVGVGWNSACCPK